MWGEIMNESVIKEMARSYGKTIAQIIIRWNIQRGIVVIPMSSKQHRIIENADVFDFKLSKSDLQFLNNLNENRRIGGVP